MNPQLVSILDNIGAGTFISGAIVLITAGIALYKLIKKTKNEMDQRTKDKVLEDKKREEEAESLEVLIDKMASLESKFDQQSNELRSYVDDRLETVTTRIEGNEKLVKKLRTEVMDYKNTTDKILETIHKIDEKIGILIDSDKETIRTFIMTEYNKWVIDKKEIDLISLQNIERLYTKYLEEIGDSGDEFIEKLIKELRNLPTKR